MINRDKFFDGVRSGPFPGHLTTDQVRGMGELLDVWEEVANTEPWKSQHRPSWLWYPAVNLANVYRETGGLMVPVREGFAKTDAAARRAVRGRKYAVTVKGVMYYGRGRIQNTWFQNYEKLSKRFGVDLVSNPDLILTDSALDAQITVHGHLEGIWSGHKLSDYLEKNPPDLINSRRCVNILDHAAEIAATAKAFYNDLRAAA